MAPGKQKHYAVRQGRSVGVLSTWDECKESVLGCKGAQYKSFATEREAQEWLAAGTVQPIQDLSSYMPGGASNKRPALGDDDDYEADYSSKRSAVARPGNSQLAVARPAAAQQGGGHWSVGVRAMQQSHHASRGGAAGGHPAATSVVSGAATQTARATQKPGSEVIISSVKSEGMMAATSLPACDPNKHYCMNFDGASRGNPGQAGSGVTVYERDSGVEVAALTHPLPYGCTNNEAEYCGLILGLEACAAMGIQKLTAKGDSNLVVKQVKGDYRVNAANLVPYHEAAQQLLAGWGRSVKVEHVYREANARADHLSNVAADQAAARPGARGR